MKPTGTLVFAFSERFEEMRRFYEQALGIPGRPGGPNWVEFTLGTARIALHRQVADQPQPPGQYQLDLIVPDIDAAVAAFAAAGATVVRGVQDEAFGRSAVLKDLEGRVLTLVQEEPH